MILTDIFVKRPVLAICINLLILVGGIQAMRNLVTKQYPKSDLSVVTVRTAFIGASADLVRGFVTTPLERVIASADGIDYLESSSSQGQSVITAHLRLNFDVNSALTQVQTKVAQVRNELPPEAEAPVIDVETADSRFAAMYMSFYSEELDSNQITDYLTRVVQPKLSAVPGVQKAEILGKRVFAMRIWLKTDMMAARQVSPSDVSDALRDNNALSAIGGTKGAMVTVNLTTNTDLRSKEEFENLVVKNDGTNLVRLGDIADVVLGAETYDEDVRFDGKTATFVGVWALPNANSLDVVREVRAVLPEIEHNLPPAMRLGIPYDSTKYIRDSIYEVIKTLLETIAIVILVIFVFIGSLRSVLVPVIAIPLSLIGGALIMFMLGFTINLLTLLAIVLAVGLVVDDAIVMLENVERHVEEGMKPYDAALRAGRELFGPIVAMTITLAAVYAPIGFQGGLTGALFREFAFTLAGAVLISGFVALTLSPMMSSKLVRDSKHSSRFKRRVEGVFGALQGKYENTLNNVLHYRAAVLVFALIVMFCVIPFYMFSNKELAPREDQGVVFSIMQSAPNASLEQIMLFATRLTDVYRAFPEYDTSFQISNPGGGFAGMITKPWAERTRNTQQIAQEAWRKASAIAGLRAIVITPPPLPGGSNFPFEVVLSSTFSHAELLRYAELLTKAALASGKFMYTDMDLKYDLAQSEVVIDRDKVAAMGLNLDTVGRDIAVITGGNYVNRFNIEGRSYKVIPQAKRSERLVPEQLLELHIEGPLGQLVPLATIATISDSVQPRELKRFQQLNSVTIQGATIPGNSLDSCLRVLEDEAAKILPAGYTLDYVGESRQLRKEGNALLYTLLIAIVIIYLVLASQFESFRDPFIILLGSVPLALAGSLAFVFLGFTSMNIYSQIGLVTLVGLVSKNGILIVEFANSMQEQGLDKFQAVVKGASVRLRPVLMTSVATVAGHMPLIFASGAGSQARNSIGYVLVTGMVVGTVFTLFIVPALYTFMASKKGHAG